MDIDRARYVSFTTFRRSGEAVPTPVWIAPLPDGRLGFTTSPDAGKVKRLCHTAAVELRPSDARGRAADGAEPVVGTAVVVTDGPDRAAVVAALGRKYGIQFAAVHLGSRLRQFLGRGPVAAVVVTVSS